MKIDVSGMLYEPKSLGRSRALKEYPSVGWSSVSIIFAAHAEPTVKMDVHKFSDRGELISFALSFD